MRSKPRILVTGGSGYIGSALVKEALSAGYQVHVLDGAPLPADAVLTSALESGMAALFAGSIANISVLQHSLEGVEAVIHLAGVSDGRAGKANPVLTQQVNEVAMQVLLAEAATAGVKRFLFASTMGVYGNAYKCPLTEELELIPVDPYSASKAVGEQLLQASGSAGFCTVALRIAMVYGVGVRIREDFLLNKMCQLAVQEGKLSLAGGAQKRPQIHINDLTALFLKLLQADAALVQGEIFNAVASSPSVAQMAEAICEVLPQTVLTRQPPRAEEDSFEMDGSKLRKVLGFTPSISLIAGIEQTVYHFQQAL